MALARSHVSQETPTAAALVSVLKRSTRFSSAHHTVLREQDANASMNPPWEDGHVCRRAVYVVLTCSNR